jgi:3-hydroxybutyryl-CoA dehydrogenase
MSTPITTAAVLGAGTMGHGIAHVAAASGMKVVLYDIDQSAADRGLASIQQNLEKGVAKNKITEETKAQALGNLSTSTNLEEAVSSAQLVVEAAPERLDLKQSIFKQIDSLAPSDAIFGTNTSSLSITKIASVCTHPERVLGMHFFNPPHILKLLELIKTEHTSDDALAKAKAIGEQMGRDLIVINDSPGFATSRLGLIIGLEAMRMLQEGVGTAEDIDRAMELGYRHPMGPLRLTDLVGLDVRLDIAEYLHRELGGDRFDPPQILRELVEAGKLGKKSGQGFYKWD